MFRTSQRALNERAVNFKSGITSKLDGVRRELKSKRRKLILSDWRFDHPYCPYKGEIIQNGTVS